MKYITNHPKSNLSDSIQMDKEKLCKSGSEEEKAQWDFISRWGWIFHVSIVLNCENGKVFLFSDMLNSTEIKIPLDLIDS